MSSEDRSKFETGAAAWQAMSERRGETLPDGSIRKSMNVYGDYGNDVNGQPHDNGRWPTNVAFEERVADELDRQNGVRTYGEYSGQDVVIPARGAETGGASRFFPVFKYEPKAPTRERPSVDGKTHPTVKPLDLMRWLVRLVTPPGGTVLEPFLGSGTTGEACVVEGFRCVGIEREAEYMRLAVERLSKPIQQDLFGASA